MAAGGQLYENLRQLITVVDELRDCGLQNYISLPRIAACGTQSSGKSSLIESVVGLDFLPRGGGVVTRRPLELRLVHLSSLEHEEGTAWAVFDKSQTKITDFDKVRAEIERLTEEVAGKNKGIVDDPITLTVYATGAPDLTLIDLPGITRVPIKGSDQVEDIEKLTRDMTKRYVEDPRTIIMAVLPANQDISTSDALQVARKVDPKGNRTIGIVTKIDIMDQGTDACRMLRGEDIPLKLGYVGVKMRSQQDIENKKPVKKAIEDEKEWFANHRLYSKLPPGLVGTNFLINNLTTVLFKHIRRFLPEIKREINERRRDVQFRLDELGEGVPVEPAERIQLMWTMVTDFTDMFKNSVRGRFDRRLQMYMKSGSDMSSGSQLRGIFNEFLGNDAENGVTSDMTDADIQQAIRMHEGDSLPGFPSPDTFEFLIIPHLKKLMGPAVDCVNSVAACLEQLSNRMVQCVLRRFPKLSEATLSLAASIIQRERENTQLIVEQTMQSETSYLFTNDLDYLAQNGSMLPGADEQENKEEQEKKSGLANRVRQGTDAVVTGSKNAYIAVANQFKEQMKPHHGAQYSQQTVTEIRRRLDAYFALVVRNSRDAVPKTIGHFLVRQVADRLQFEIYSALSKEHVLSELLGEPEHIREERRSLSAQLATLQRASSVLTRDPALASVIFDAEEGVDEEDATGAPAASQGGTQAASKVAGGAAAGEASGIGARAAGLFASATEKMTQGVEQVKQKVAQTAANQAVSQATGGAIKEVPPAATNAALQYAEKNPEKVVAAAKAGSSAASSLFGPSGGGLGPLGRTGGGGAM